MSLGQKYQNLYDRLCGRHPRQKPWHFQWLSARAIREGNRNALSAIKEGSFVLDAGCGHSPYRSFMPKKIHYTGLDIKGAGTTADIQIEPGMKWPLDNASFDYVLASQVLEHVVNVNSFLSEVFRVLKENGHLIITIPFIYGEHGKPHDYRRLTVNGLEELLSPDYEMIKSEKLGSIGTVLGTLLLNWMDECITKHKLLMYLKPVLLPFWLMFCLLVNLFFFSLNYIDKTDSYYQDTLVIAKKVRV